MPHTIEAASSGRAKCRACGEKIASGELRFGERLPNPFADDGGEMTHWYHVQCAAYRRPEALLEIVETADVLPVEGRERLAADARFGIAHRRVPRVNVAERAATGRATCRSCRALIEKGAWRISLVFYEEGRFTPGGFVHATCAVAHFETADILARIRHFSPALDETGLAELGALIRPAS